MAIEYITVAEARDYLGISRGKMTSLIKNGKLTAIENPLDSRSKLIKRADVEKLKLRI
jgi:excisionase family DNA binding protein